MGIQRTALLWLARWRRARDSKHRSGWDRGNTDVLAFLIKQDRLRKSRRLP